MATGELVECLMCFTLYTVIFWNRQFCILAERSAVPSRTINRLLQAVREEGVWEEWVEYMLNAVTETAHSTMQLINDIKDLMIQMKHRMREELPKLYSQDLLNNLFRYPYTRIEFLEKDLPYTRQTARKYLEVLSDSGFVRKVSVGRNNYYINHALVDLFVNVPLASTVD